MLNEKIEFKAYIEDPESSSPRVQPKLLTDSFKPDIKLNGLSQVLTVIARGFLFSEEYGKEFFDEEGLITEKGISATKELLSRWCGFQEDVEKRNSQIVDRWFAEFPSAEGWLKNFLIYQYGKGKAEGEKKWKQYEEKWCEKFHSDYAYTKKSFTFENIIAEALEKGKLRERYCIVKKDKEKGIRDLEGLYLYCFGKSRAHSPTKLKLLRNIIAFRIWQEEHPISENAERQKEVLLQKLRLFGWYGQDDHDGKQKNWCFAQFSWSGKQIMNCIKTDENENFVKFAINAAYLERFGFWLIAPEEAENYAEEYWIIKDMGHGEEHPFEIINAEPN